MSSRSVSRGDDRTMNIVLRPRIGLASLNLLWALPLAFVFGYFPAGIVRFERCGFDNCRGEVMGFASRAAPTALGVAALAAVAMFGAFGGIPWLRPARVRFAIALLIAVLVFIAYVWLILFRQ